VNPALETPPAFSAAVNFLDALRFETNGTIVGEPSGAGGTHFGDAQFHRLPNSGVFFFLSTRQWESKDSTNQENAILLTFDKDFGDLVFRQRRISQGVVLIRLHGFTAEEKAAIVENTIKQYGLELPRAFTVVTPNKVRVRSRLN